MNTLYYLCQADEYQNETFFVQKIQRQADLGRIKPRMFFGQTALTLHVKHQISAIDELDNEE